jgi:hypothetical protein
MHPRGRAGARSVMLALALCVAAFLSTLLAGRRSLAWGLITMLFWGYFWGIFRANFPTTASYFVFDSSLLGFYGGRGKMLFGDNSARVSTLKMWTLVLIIWPCILVFMPMQHPLVSLVGLRGNVFFMPMILAGAVLADETILTLSTGLAVLNLMAVAFATGEYVLGVPTFYPLNAATQLIYMSNDVAGYQYLRIPGTFGTAHVFGGTMVTSLPFLYGAWSHPETGGWKRILLLAGMIAALMGVMMSSTRLHFVIAAALVLCMVVSGKFSFSSRAVILGVMLILGIVASTNERFGRFKSLGDSEGVNNRIHGSVNRGFWEILNEYPMGNGLGGGGTSIPFFLQDLVRQPVAMENEYARILLETGIVGLALWAGFIIWFVLGSAAFVRDLWRPSRRIGWVCCIGYFGVGMIGIGMLTAVPQTALMLLLLGWVGARPATGLALQDSTPRFAAPGYPSVPRTHESMA